MSVTVEIIESTVDVTIGNSTTSVVVANATSAVSVSSVSSYDSSILGDLSAAEANAEAQAGYAEEWASSDSDVSVEAGGGVGINSAKTEAEAAAADAVLTAADVVSTGLDVVATNADVVSTNADVVLTNADVVATGNDLTATNQDTVDTAADVVLTNADAVSTGNDVTSCSNSASAATTAQGLAEDAQGFAEDAQTAAEAAQAAAEDAADSTGTSVSSVLIGTGAKSFETQADKYWVTGHSLKIVSDADPTVDYMICVVTSYSGTTLNVTVSDAYGSGTHTDWTISMGASDHNHDTDYLALSGGTLTGDLDVPNVSVSGVVNAAGGVDVGDPGFEASGININGVTYTTGLRVNDIGGSNAAQMVIHRHSTTLQPLLLGARSNTNDNTHAAVTTGQSLFTTFASGWTASHYDLFGSSDFKVGTGTVSATSSPGKWVLSLTPDGSNLPTACITVDSDKSAVFAGDISGTNLSGTNTGDQDKANIDALGIEASSLSGLNSTVADLNVFTELAPYASATPDTYINVTAGSVLSAGSGQITTVAEGTQVAGKTGFVADTYSALNVIYMDTDGDLYLFPGASTTGTPVIPRIPYGTIAICAILETGPSDTIVETADITDLRKYNFSSLMERQILTTNIENLDATASELNVKEYIIDVTLGTSKTEYVKILWPCTVTRIDSVIDGALSGTDETLTFKDDSNNDMDSVMTIAVASSTGGTDDTVLPSTNNTFSANDILKIAIGGENSNAVKARITIRMDLG